MTRDANELLKQAVEAHAEVLKAPDENVRTIDEIELNVEHKKGKNK